MSKKFDVFFFAGSAEDISVSIFGGPYWFIDTLIDGLLHSNHETGDEGEQGHEHERERGIRDVHSFGRAQFVA